VFSLLNAGWLTLSGKAFIVFNISNELVEVEV
jgi:hypothetical protein